MNSQTQEMLLINRACLRKTARKTIKAANEQQTEEGERQIKEQMLDFNGPADHDRIQDHW